MKTKIIFILLMDFVCLLSANAQSSYDLKRMNDVLDDVLERKRREVSGSSTKRPNTSSYNRPATSNTKSHAVNESSKNRARQNQDAKNIAKRINDFSGQTKKSSVSQLSESQNNNYKQQVTGGLIGGQSGEDLKTVSQRSRVACGMAETGNKDLAMNEIGRTFIDMKKAEKTKSPQSNAGSKSTKTKTNANSKNSENKTLAKNGTKSIHRDSKKTTTIPASKQTAKANQHGNNQNKKRIQNGIQNGKKPLRSGKELWEAHKNKESLTPEEKAKLNEWIKKNKNNSYK